MNNGTDADSGHKQDLLHALSAASTALQRSARSEADVFRAFSEQIGQLGLLGVISLFDNVCQEFVIRAIARPDERLSMLETLANSQAIGFHYHMENHERHRRVIELAETVYSANVSHLLVNFLPENAQQYNQKVIDAFGTLPGIFAPLRIEGRILGIVMIFGSGLTSDDTFVVELFANHLAVALDNANLFAELHEKEERLRSIFQESDDGIALSDEQGKIIEWNPGEETITGLKRVDVIGKYLWDIQFQMLPRERQTPDDFEGTKASIQDMLARGIPVKPSRVGEHKIQRPDGSMHIIQMHGFTLKTEKGFRVGAITRDVTQFHTMEATLRQRAEELEMLHAVSLDITASTDLPSLLKAVIERAMHLLHAPGGSLYLSDNEKQQLICVVSLGNRPDYSGSILNFGEGAAGVAVRDGKPLLIDDYRLWDNQVKYGPDELSVTAILTVPMASRGQVLGALQLMHHAEGAKFTGEDQKLLTLFADQASIAIFNARLLVAEREARLQAETLRELAGVISGSLDIHEILRLILDQLRNVFVFDTCSVLLYPESDRPAMIAGIGYEDVEMTSQAAGDLLKSSEILKQISITLQPMIIPDVRNNLDWIWIPGAEHVRSFLGVPIVAGQRLIGVLMADSRQIDFFRENEARLVQALAQHMAVAIVNAQLYEAQEQRTAELEAVHQASLGVTSSLNLEAVLDTILTHTLHLLPNAQNAHIFLYHEENETITFGAALWREGKRGEPMSIPRRNGLTYTVALSGQPVLVPDMTNHPLYQNLPPGTDWHGSIAGLPLKIGERVVGVMNISFSDPRPFPPAEVRVLRLLGDQAAIAIENARLFQQAAEERRHLSLLYDLGRALASTLDPDEILERAIRLTCESLGGVVGEAFLCLPEEKRLSLRSLFGRDEISVAVADASFNLHIGEGLAGWVAANSKPANVSNVSQDSRWVFLSEMESDVRSAVAAPIMSDSGVLGVITVLHSKPAAFSDNHLALLEAICQQVSLALSNAEGFQQVRSLAELLAAEQRRLESLIERLPVGVLLLDSDFRLLVANPLGHELLEALCPPGQGEYISRFGNIAIQKLVSHYNDPLPVEIHLDAPRRVFETQARPIGMEDSPVSQRQWALTVREITLERENQMRIQMQERLATVGQLAAGIAHDFNNIMAAIMVYSDLLINDLAAYPTSRERVTIIQQQVQRAASLIRQILDFSRRSVMEQTVLDLLPFIKELFKLLHRVLPETIQLELICQPGAYMLSADPTRLQQVFMNLALNASDAMSQGGSLRFDITREVKESSQAEAAREVPAGEWIKILVSDTGHGISQDVLPHIFEPFFTTKPAGKGTGLGLAQVYGIVKQHNGFIYVNSQPGQGSKFAIYLPALILEQKEEASPSSAQTIDGRDRIVLIVEDDDATRGALCASLEQLHFHVLQAPSGIDALNLLEGPASQISLVVSDVIMPKMGGIALYNRVQERWPEINFLFITGHPLDAETRLLLEQRNIQCLPKPFSIHDFAEAVGRSINKQHDSPRI